MSQTWERTKGISKRGFDKAWQTLDKLGRPVNQLSNKLGAEAFWPTTLDKECDKAARILRSFCKDGFYDHITPEGDQAVANGGRGVEDMEGVPRGKQRVVKKIPASVIAQAKGLAIFTTMRTGLWVSGAGGSGVLLSRVEETGEWSPPSGIMLHTSGLGFLVGVDIYDCVLVINTYEALEAFKNIRCTLGGEVSAVAGPVGIGGVLETEVHKRQAPVWTYLKSRGFYAGVQVDGSIVIERTDENERFYGGKISVADILAGKVRRPPSSINTLMQTIKAAQGDRDVDENLLPPPGETPGDVDIHLEGTFGIPDNEDADPYGVRALEKQGVMIREAGSRRIPGIEIFEFRPSPTSPVFSNFSRYSIDGSRRSSWRNSMQSAMSVDRSTQTDIKTEKPGSISPTSRTSSRSLRHITSCLNANNTPGSDTDDTSHNGSDAGTESSKDSSTFLDAQNAQKPIALSDHSVPNQVSPTSPSFTRAKLVTIPKRVPPPVPQRNPERALSPLSTLSEARNTGLLSPPSEDEVVSLHDDSTKEKSHSWQEPWSISPTSKAQDGFTSAPNSPELSPRGIAGAFPQDAND